MMRRLPQNGQSGAVVLYFVLFLLVVSALTAAYQRLVLPAMTVGVASRTLVVRQACLDSARAAAEAAFGKTCIKDGDVECSNFKKDAVVTVEADSSAPLACSRFTIEQIKQLFNTSLPEIGRIQRNDIAYILLVKCPKNNEWEATAINAKYKYLAKGVIAVNLPNAINAESYYISLQ